jgi:hypothetical protein
MFQFHSIALLCLKFPTTPVTTLSAGRRFVELYDSDVERFVEIERSNGRRGDVARMHRRFAYGFRCFAIEEAGTLIAWFWVTPRVRYLDELQWQFDLGANEVWLRDGYCSASHRGQRLVEALLLDAWSKLGRPHRYLTDVETGNRSSMRMHERMGFETLAIVRSLAIGDRFHIRDRPPAALPAPKNLRPSQRVIWLGEQEYQWHLRSIA